MDVRVRKTQHTGKRFSSVGFLEVTVRLGRRDLGGALTPAYEFQALRYYLVMRIPRKPTRLIFSEGDLLWKKRTL